MPYVNPHSSVLPSSKLVSIPSGNPNYRTWPLTKITFGISKKKQQELNDLNSNITFTTSPLSSIPLRSSMELSDSNSVEKKTETIEITTESVEKTIVNGEKKSGEEEKEEKKVDEKRSEPKMIKNDKILDRDDALKQVKDILSTSPQLSTSPRRKSAPESFSRKFSLKVDLLSTQQFSQELQELSPSILRKKSGEILKPSLKRGKSEPVTPTFPKYVHFNSDLEQIKLFDGAQRPQAVSADVSSDEDTDDDDFVFSVSDSDDDRRRYHHLHDDEEEPMLVINLPNMPRMTTEHCSKYVFVESIFLSGDKRKLQGRIHVKNIAFHKVVKVRYTFDFWQSVSEVTATYVDGGSNRSQNLQNFDIFVFSIELIDNSRNPIDGKVMYFAVRYLVNDSEYWDNNEKQNYQVNFKRVSSNPRSSSSSSSLSSSSSSSSSSSLSSSLSSSNQSKKIGDNNSKPNNSSYFNKWSPSPIPKWLPSTAATTTTTTTTSSISKSSKSSKSSSSTTTTPTSSSSSLRHTKALEAGSPPPVPKNTNKKSGRYDLSVSLSAVQSATSTAKNSSSLTTTTTTTTTKTTSSSSSSSSSSSHSNNSNTPSTPGDNPVHQYFPTISCGDSYSNSLFPNYIDGTSSEMPMTAATSWDDAKSNPIAIPSSKSSIGSASYYEFVNQYCFYQGSPYTANSPHASSPSVLT